MRVLFTVVGVLGHIHPLVPIARAVQAAGHEVACAVPAPVLPTVERAGFRCFPADVAPARESFGRAFPEMLALTGTDLADFHRRHVFAGLRAEPMARDVHALAPARRPDVIVRDDAELGGCVAAERLGLLHAAVQVIADRPRLRALIAGPLGELRAAGRGQRSPHSRRVRQTLG